MKSKKKVKLDELNVFKDEQEVLDYIQLNRLNLISKNKIDVTEILSQIQNLILNYLKGQKVNLLEEIKKLNVDLDINVKFKSVFSQKVVNILLKLKPGEVTTYYDIGNKINSKAYRAIGNVCKSNPIPLIIPCHRVVRKSGEIGGFMGKSGKTWETNLKKQLLKLEKHTL